MNGLDLLGIAAVIVLVCIALRLAAKLDAYEDQLDRERPYDQEAE